MAFDAVRFRELMTHFMPDLFRQGLDINRTRQEAQLWLARAIAENQARTQSEMSLSDYDIANRMKAEAARQELERGGEANRFRLNNIGDLIGAASSGSPIRATQGVDFSLSNLPPDILKLLNLTSNSAATKTDLSTAYDAKTRELLAQQNLENIDPATMAILARNWKPEDISSTINEIARSKAEKTRLDLEQKRLDAAAAKPAKATAATTAATGPSMKDMQSELKTEIARQASLIGKLGAAMKANPLLPEVDPTIESELSAVNDRITFLQPQTGYKSTTQESKYREAAARLKAKGATLHHVLTDPYTQQMIRGVGLDPMVMIRYF